MIKIENVVLPSPAQMEAVIRGMRNPMNSWDKSDSYKTHVVDSETLEAADFEFFIGEKDHKLMMSLADAGSVHAKYRRMINVYLDITAPLYWWKEFDTYKIGTVANSCSTMHKIQEKEFELGDFSTEHLTPQSLELLEDTIILLNSHRALYNCKTDQRIDSFRVMADECYANYKKDIWWQVIQLLPSSYNQKRTVMVNYEVLANIYESRKGHKLDEWNELCDWIESMPYSELIVTSL